MTDSLPANGPDHGATAAVGKAYVREMLDFNPMWDAQQIILRRRELWGGGNVGNATAGNAAAIAVKPEVDQRLRDRARQCLDVLHVKFYELPQDKLLQYIGALRNERLPEYAATAARLQKVAGLRDTVLASQIETGDVKFAYSLQQSLVRPAIEGGAFREQFIESIIEERRVKPACDAVKNYLDAHPEIYALERDWFDLLLDPDNQNAWSDSYSFNGKFRRFMGWSPSGVETVGGSIKGWVAVVVFILIIVGKVAGTVSRSSRRNANTPAAPTVTTSPTGSGPQSFVNGLPSDGPSNNGSSNASGASVPAWQPVDRAPREITSSDSDSLTKIREAIEKVRLENERAFRESQERMNARIEEDQRRLIERNEERRARSNEIRGLIKRKSFGPDIPMPGFHPAEMPMPSIMPPNYQMPTPPGVPQMRMVPGGNDS